MGVPTSTTSMMSSRRIALSFLWYSAFTKHTENGFGHAAALYVPLPIITPPFRSNMIFRAASAKLSSCSSGPWTWYRPSFSPTSLSA